MKRKSSSQEQIISVHKEHQAGASVPDPARLTARSSTSSTAFGHCLGPLGELEELDASIPWHGNQVPGLSPRLAPIT